MTTLTEFVLSRIAEDEAAAREMMAAEAEVAELPPVPTYVPVDDEDLADYRLATFAHVLRHDPARVLAECAALRAVVEEHAADGERCRTCAIKDDMRHSDGWGDWPYPCPTLRALASIWARHEAYDPEWRLT